MHGRHLPFACAVFVALGLALAGAGQEKGDKADPRSDKVEPKTDRGEQPVDKAQAGVPPARLESVLAKMNVKYDKTEGKKKDDWFYEFDRNNFKIRLQNYGGRDLGLDVVFTDKITLKEVNGWNVQAKFSRAVRLSGGDKSPTSLEAQLDCEGGVTEGMIRQFILRFDSDLKNFVEYLAK
jgi:hypothetical protein